MLQPLAARNPFIGSDQYDEFIENSKKKKVFQVLDSEGKPVKDATGKIKIDQTKMKQCTDLFEPWVLNKGEMLGTEVRAAHKDMSPLELVAQRSLLHCLFEMSLIRRTIAKNCPFLPLELQLEKNLISL